ncbi:MAG: glycosyltransferase family 39 protein [Flavobacteriaceae bacterium]|nr:glycosyltransferase family 39 protein [Flavobacteriaceae bacterium]
MKKLQQLTVLQALLIFCLTAFLIRFPFFFRDYIDHDESTFIIMGQSLIDGHLPYLELWDLKPPAVFYFFAGLIGIFGKSIFAIRLIGSLIVALTAWFTYKISLHFFDKISSFFSGLLCIYLLSLFGALQGVMSEHLAALPLTAGLFFLIKKQNFTFLLLSGMCFGLAIMFRLNLAYALFFIYAYILIQNGLRLQNVVKAAILTCGSLIIFFIIATPYIFTQNTSIFISSVFEASLAYSNVDWAKMLKTLPLVIGLILLSLLSIKYLSIKGRKSDFILLIIMIIGQGIMFFKGGKINGHYLIQVFPFLIILVIAFSQKITLNNKFQKILFPIILFVLLALPVETYLEIRTILQSKSTTGSFYNGEGHTIPRYLIQKFGKEKAKNSFFLNEHIAYWNLDSRPPTAAATHPSNIFRESVYPYLPVSQGNPEMELRYILEQIQPNFIVLDEGRIPMEKGSNTYDIFLKNLETQYIHEKEFGNNGRVKLYKRIN